MKRLFLGGGGSEADSKALDRHFVETLDLNKTLIYIPNAITSRTFGECYGWFKSVFYPLNVANMEMWDHLQPNKDVNEIAGIYIGGGDTHQLLQQLRSSGFVDYLLQAINSGIPVYGGSAGAIILGKDIRSAPEASKLSKADAEGLNVLAGRSVVCHYDPAEIDGVKALVGLIESDIIAIPEKTGVILDEDNITTVGTEPAWMITHDEMVELTAEKYMDPGQPSLRSWLPG